MEFKSELETYKPEDDVSISSMKTSEVETYKPKDEVTLSPMKTTAIKVSSSTHKLSNVKCIILSSQKIVTFQLFLVLWLFITKVRIVCVSDAFKTGPRNKEVLRRLRSGKRFKGSFHYDLLRICDQSNLEICC